MKHFKKFRQRNKDFEGQSGREEQDSHEQMKEKDWKKHLRNINNGEQIDEDFDEKFMQ